MRSYTCPLRDVIVMRRMRRRRKTSDIRWRIDANSSLEAPIHKFVAEIVSNLKEQKKDTKFMSERVLRCRIDA